MCDGCAVLHPLPPMRQTACLECFFFFLTARYIAASIGNVAALFRPVAALVFVARFAFITSLLIK
jgi:hypothetical protein